MEHHELIIGELEREQRGEQLADPKAFAEGLEIRGLQILVSETIKSARGDARADLRQLITYENLTRSAPDEQEAANLAPDEVLRQLEIEEAGQEVLEPGILAHALLAKAKEVRELLIGEAEQKQTTLAA